MSSSAKKLNELLAVYSKLLLFVSVERDAAPNSSMEERHEARIAKIEEYIQALKNTLLSQKKLTEEELEESYQRFLKILLRLKQRPFPILRVRHLCHLGPIPPKCECRENFDYPL